MSCSVAGNEDWVTRLVSQNKIPTFIHAARKDHISPFASVYKGVKLFPGDVTFEGATARLTASGRAALDKLTAYLTMYPNVTDPFPPAAATVVPSLDHESERSEPLFGLSKLCDQPVLSQSLSISKAPTAKTSPFGDHLTLVTTWS